LAATTAIHTLALHDALPIWARRLRRSRGDAAPVGEAHGLTACREASTKDCDAEVAVRLVVALELGLGDVDRPDLRERVVDDVVRSEEHTSELQSREKLVCRL